MGRTVSQKKYLKGLNAGTGALTEPTGTVTRMSNLVFTQRGSLQTVNGSGIIGQLSTPYSVARAFGTFSNFSVGQYSYYPVLTSPTTYLVPDPTPVNATHGTGTDNPAGLYAFCVVATDVATGNYHSDYRSSIVVMNADTSFDGVSLDGWVNETDLEYSAYYMPAGSAATQGVLIVGPVQNASSLASIGVLPTTPLVTLPTPNNSFNYGLSIGNIVAPSKEVLFSIASTVSIPAYLPQPAALAPGDPNFQFQTLGTWTSTYTTGSVSASASRSASLGTTIVNGTASSALPSVSIASGQSISFSAVLSASLVGSGLPAGGASVVNYQYSPDAGSTWITFYTFGNGGQNYNTSPSQTFNGSISGVTNLSNLLFRVQAQATCGGTTGTFSADGTIASVSISLTTFYSFTPYGGITGFACPIPQILQFNQVSILILGNGYAPQYFNPSSLAAASLNALGNTFQATFPNWQASVAWAQGDSIAVTISGTDYQFTAQQSGVSGSTTPTFPSTLGATVADGQLYWKNVGAITTSIAPRGAAHGIVYAGSLWLANTSPQTTADNLDGPTCLKMSDSNNQNSWNPANIAFLGKDDGTQITGLASYTVAELGIAPTGSLVVFKEFSTYQIIGVFGATDFQITQAQTDLGCIGARTISFLPGYGIMRLTHMGFAIFNGVNDTLVSEEIRPYIFGGIGLNSDITGIDFTYCYLSKGVQCTSPPMYICGCPLSGTNGTITRLFIYDLVLKAWTIMDLPWQITTLSQARTGEGAPLTIGVKADGSGAVERLFSGDSTWDAASLVSALTPSATDITWSFRTTHVYREGSSLRAFYRKVTVRGYSAQTVAKNVVVTVQVNGNPFKQIVQRIQPQPTSQQFEIDIDLLLTAQNVQINLSGSGVVTVDAVDWDVTEKKGGAIVIG